jgi:hypothetical protein
MDDMLAAESLIVARLQAALPDSVRVLTGTDPAITRSSGQLLPAVFVLFGGDEVVQAAGQRRLRFGQRWEVSLAVRSVNDRAGTAAKDAAGPLLVQIHDALCGWRPSPDYSELTRQPMARPEYDESGAALIYTVAFTTNATLNLET